jgi:hypothetical protein
MQISFRDKTMTPSPRFRHAAAALAASLALSACAATTGNTALDIPEVAQGDISQATMVDVTRTLSSDEFEGRMPGTMGEEKTVALLSERFAAAGLQPGNNGSWVQQVPLVEITGKDFAPLTVTARAKPWRSSSATNGSA